MKLTPETIAKTNTESAHQKALFAQVAIHCAEYPRHAHLFRWLHAIPNGGTRSMATGARMKAEGTKAGVLDIFLPVARGGYHGLYIEMKKPGKIKNLSSVQEEFIEHCNANNYWVVVCDNWQDAWKALWEYLEMNL